MTFKDREATSSLESFFLFRWPVADVNSPNPTLESPVKMTKKGHESGIPEKKKHDNIKLRFKTFFLLVQPSLSSPRDLRLWSGWLAMPFLSPFPPHANFLTKRKRKGKERGFLLLPPVKDLHSPQICPFPVFPSKEEKEREKRIKHGLFASHWVLPQIAGG